MTLTDAIVTAGLTMLGALGGAGVKAWADTRKAHLAAPAAEGMSDAAVRMAVNDQFDKIMQARDKQADEDREQIVGLRGEIRELTQHITSLENRLRDHGIDIPQRKPGEHRLAIIEGGLS